MYNEHSHNKSSAIIQYLRPGIDIREMFLEYFHDMSPAVALRVYQDKLRCQHEDDYEKINADGHVMPLDNTVYYWHKQWRTLNYGPINDPLKTLVDKIDLYKEQGTTVVVRTEKPWSVLIATPVMKRAHNAFCNKSIVFCDTSASCDSTSAHVTLMLTATKAGAVPLCVLIHEGQSEESYTTAFALFRETFPNGFCGEDAEWRWLEKNAVSDIRQSLMKAFQEIQYAKSCELLEEAIESLKTLNEEYYEASVKKLLEKKEEWVQLFRDNLPIGGHHTNNYAEATVRILKDVILQRTKAYNVVALTDYVVNGWENYLQNKLSKYAFKRMANPLRLYNDLLNRIPAALADKIIQIDEDTFHVPSAVNGEATYEKFGKLFPNQPLICSADRYVKGQMAFGDRCPEKEFFLDPKETLENLEKDLEELYRLYTPNAQRSIEEIDVVMEPAAGRENPNLESDGESDSEILENAEEIINTFTSNWKRISEHGLESNAKGYLKLMVKANKSLDKVTNNNLAFAAIMDTSNALRRNIARAGKKIKVQPTSIQRRRPGFTKGNSRVPTGRPSNALRSVDFKPKRRHCLKQNVAANRHHV
ncbi:putative cell division protein WhiA [Frankliniella fusca]|uniref:Cell division protein WhiA n=1 Tax=Frankliniella fusca TaxID=407009 RepID=A0AAE1I1J2_9NEOP|nr:putative cell division protein WhiA [Frankliniella fusca]